MNATEIEARRLVLSKYKYPIKQPENSEQVNKLLNLLDTNVISAIEFLFLVKKLQGVNK